MKGRINKPENAKKNKTKKEQESVRREKESGKKRNVKTIQNVNAITF